MSSWKNTITALSSQALQKRGLPVAIKELAWRLIRFVATCGRSHPVSFALRPLTAHKHFRLGIGASLAVIFGILTIWGPLPSFAGDSIGGPVEINIHSEGEINLATVPSVQLPVADFRLTQGYSWHHPGIDMATKKGQVVRPVMTGSVTVAEYGRFGYGNNIQIAHANGYASRYAHLSKIEVAVGQTVALDTPIGEVGSTGRSSGPHLHLEISTNGATVNPKTLLDIK